MNLRPILLAALIIAIAAPSLAETPGGSWRVWRDDVRGDLYAWLGDDGRMAIEVPFESTGWFRWRLGGSEAVVFASGETRRQSFWRRPWSEHGAGAFTPVERLEWPAEYGTSTLTREEDGTLRWRLVDGGELTLESDPPAIRYRSPRALRLALGASGGATVGPTLGDDRQSYAFGDWTLLWMRARNALYAWRDDGALAIEVEGQANGWFRVRAKGVEHAVLSSGERQRAPFVRHPWEARIPRGDAAPADGSVELAGMDGATRLAVREQLVEITLPDGGRIELPRTEPKVTFHPASGAPATWP